MANRLLQIRQKIGISQAELAQELGVTAGNISHIETGKHGLSVDLAKALVVFCSRKNVPISLDDIFSPELAKEGV